MGFQRAERRRAFLKLAITGPTGSGKTYSALRLAFGLGGPVAMIDTENGSGSLYAHLGEYDVQELHPPFTAQKYINAVREAAGGGYRVLIIDSLSHAWAGEGGLLDQKSARDQRGGNSFANWAEVSKFHEQLKGAVLQSQLHVIACMRSKMEYVQEADERGKLQVRRVGMAPIQREEMPYEFTVVFDIDAQHQAMTSKDRTGLFTDQVSQLTEDHGRRIVTWLESGAAPADIPATPAPTPQPNPGPTTAANHARGGERHDTAPIANSNPRPAPPAENLEMAAPPAAGVAKCEYDGCGVPLNSGQATLSKAKFGRLICPPHQKEMAA